MYLGSFGIDDYVGIPAATHRFSTGAAYAPTVLTYSIYEEATDVGLDENVDMVVGTPFDGIVGCYWIRRQLTAAAGFEAGKNYVVVVKATVDSVAAIQMHTFQVAAKVDARYVGGTIQTAGDVPALVATADAAVDALVTTVGIAGASLTSIPNSAGVGTLLTNVPDVISLAAINAEVDTALNTAIPGTPTADSINERMVAVDAAAGVAAAYSIVNSGVGFRGTVTAADPGVSFTIGTLAGIGAGAFIDVTTPWYAYVFRDAGGVAAAPQGEAQIVTGYTSASGLFTTAAFTAPVAVGDDIIIQNPRLADMAIVRAQLEDIHTTDLPAVKADTAAILEDTAEIGTAGAGLTAVVLATPAPTALENADALLKRDMSAVSGESARSPLNALRLLRNKWSVAAGTLTVTKEDDTASAWTSTVSSDAAANPITGSDPA